MSDDMEITTESGVSPKGRPFVNVLWPSAGNTQWDVDEARAFALTILEAAEAAAHDAAFWKWLQEGPLDLEPAVASRLVGEQRQYRAGL